MHNRLDGISRPAVLSAPSALSGVAWRNSDSPATSPFIDANIHRRHLDESQRAMVARKLANMPTHRPNKLANLPTSQTDAAAIASLRILFVGLSMIFSHHDQESNRRSMQLTRSGAAVVTR
jgi:hypothetical protein